MEPTMSQFFAMVVYRCIVAGEPTGKLDIQAQYHLAGSEHDVRRKIESQSRVGYENGAGKWVDWELRAVMAIDQVEQLESGAEVVGFIADLGEIGKLA
jgi:hypothetical protein